MNVLFLSIDDVKNSIYLREGSKNLLLTPFGICDTAAICGILKNVMDTKYGPSVLINDGSADELTITVGTFNKKLRDEVNKIIEKFKKTKMRIYLLIYANPYETDRLYINANNDNSVIEINEQIFDKFCGMRKSGNEYLAKKYGKGIEEEIQLIVEETKPGSTPVKVKEISKTEIIGMIKELDEGRGVKIEDLPEKFEDKIYEMIEEGDLYEPLAGFVRVV